MLKPASTGAREDVRRKKKKKELSVGTLFGDYHSLSCLLHSSLRTRNTRKIACLSQDRYDGGGWAGSEAIDWDMDPYLNSGVVRLAWLVSSKFVRPG